MTKKPPAPEAPARHDFLSTFLDSVKKGIESLSILPSDLTGKINESIGELSRRFESRMKNNRAGLFTWTGVPAPEQLTELQEKLGRLEARLSSIEKNVKALESHQEGEPWPSTPQKNPRAAGKK